MPGSSCWPIQPGDSLVALLALGVSQPTKLATQVGLSRPAVSRQLGLLRDAGLISVRTGYVDRRRRNYCIEPRRLGQITAWLAGTEVGRAFPDQGLGPGDDVA